MSDLKVKSQILWMESQILWKISIHLNLVHRKVHWRNPKWKLLNSMPEKDTKRLLILFILVKGCISDHPFFYFINDVFSLCEFVKTNFNGSSPHKNR